MVGCECGICGHYTDDECIKNGYIVGSRHTVLTSDAVALDYITF